MDHLQVVKRAFQVTWRYKALWVFGIILALVTGGGGGGGSGGGGRGGGTAGRNGAQNWLPGIPQEVTGVLIAVGVGLACLFMALIVLSVIARWVSETALIRMVDEYEESDTRRTVWQGFRIGWSRTAWRLFLLDLVVTLPVAIIAVILFVMAGTPALLWLTKNTAAGVVGTILAVLLVLGVVLLLIPVALALSLLMPIWRRACALDDLGVIEALRRGWAVLRRRAKDLVLMWLLLIGLGLAWALLMLLVVFALLAVAVLLGGLPALLVGVLASLFADGALPWILAALVGVPIFILVVGLPMLFLNGLKEVFRSSVWTLTYRQVRAIGEAPVAQQPLDPSSDFPWGHGGL
jgi:hypothetical protein